MAKSSKTEAEDPLELVLKELRKYYKGTKRVKIAYLGDECRKK